MQSTMHQNDDSSFYTNDDTMSSFDEEEAKNFRFYPSNAHGNIIVNARTGEKYPWTVGSYESMRLFRISNITGNYDSHGQKIERGAEPNRDPNFLYYDSPEDYEEHWKQYLDEGTVKRWHSMVISLFPNGNFSKAKYDEMTAKYAGLPAVISSKTEPVHIVEEYDRRVEKFSREHPEYDMGRNTPNEMRDDVLNLLIPGSTPATGKSGSSRTRATYVV
jgi:hypothetical protein